MSWIRMVSFLQVDGYFIPAHKGKPMLGKEVAELLIVVRPGRYEITPMLENDLVDFGTIGSEVLWRNHSTKRFPLAKQLPISLIHGMGDLDGHAIL